MEIKQCPYCSSMLWNIIAYHSPNAMQLHCMDCLSRGPLKPTGDEAVEAWNRVSEVVNNSSTKCSK